MPVAQAPRFGLGSKPRADKGEMAELFSVAAVLYQKLRAMTKVAC